MQGSAVWDSFCILQLWAFRIMDFWVMEDLLASALLSFGDMKLKSFNFLRIRIFDAAFYNYRIMELWISLILKF